MTTRGPPRTREFQTPPGQLPHVRQLAQACGRSIYLPPARTKADAGKNIFSHSPVFCVPFLIFNTAGPQVPANKEVPRMRVRRGTRRGGWGEGKDIG